LDCASLLALLYMLLVDTGSGITQRLSELATALPGKGQGAFG
jgi:hypothetical protein